MRLNSQVMKNNIFTVDIEGRFTLSAAAAVVAVFGDDLTVTKTGTGTYRVRIPALAAANYRIVETLYDDANFGSGGVPTTAVNVRISGVSVDATAGATLGDWLIDITTSNATYVPTDVTAAASVCFRLVARVRNKS